jgi:hypothetical protein
MIEQALDKKISAITGMSLSEMKETSLPKLEEDAGTKTQEGTK